MGSPEISVLLPMQEDRDHGVECVRMWVEGQTLARERYEIVIAAPGVDPDLETAVREVLGARDVFVEHRTTNEPELFNAAARASSGRYLFFTEAHCVPEPDCLEQMLDHLSATDAAGVRGRSLGFAEGRFGELERIVYEGDMAPGETPDHWLKVLIHALAIRRDAYLDTGGFRPRYTDFGEWALQMHLLERGHRIDFAPGPAVRHAYTGELDVVDFHVRDFVHGELRFLTEEPTSLWEPYVPHPRELREAEALTRRGARDVVRAGVAAARGGIARRAALRAVLRALPSALAGPGGPLAAMRAATAAGRARVRLLRDPERQLRAYRRWWSDCAHAGRLEWLAENTRDDGLAQWAPEGGSTWTSPTGALGAARLSPARRGRRGRAPPLDRAVRPHMARLARARRPCPPRARAASHRARARGDARRGAGVAGPAPADHRPQRARVRPARGLTLGRSGKRPKAARSRRGARSASAGTARAPPALA